MKNYLAIGELMVDIYHDRSLSHTGYYIGGSVWNDLSNLAILPEDSHLYCVGVCGADEAGDFCIQTLESIGIDIIDMNRRKMQTKRIHIIVDAHNTRSQIECPYCHTVFWDSVQYPRFTPSPILSGIEGGIAILDTLDTEVLFFANWLKQRGWFIAADIGHIEHFILLDSQKNWSVFYKTIDLLQVPQKVFSWLCNKFSCPNAESLYTILQCRYLNVTNGVMGSTFILRNSQKQPCVIFSPTDASIEVDPTGAGDAFFSYLLYKMDRFGTFCEPMDTILHEASKYAADRTKCIGAVGKVFRMPRTRGTCIGCVF